MRTLAIDTSAGTQIAVLDGQQVLARTGREDPRGHAEHATPLIQQALAQAGLTAPAIEVVVVGTGPAPFTGLRVGLVTAQAFARARGIAVHGVTSLAAWALPALAQDQDLTAVRVITDARRREVYTARFARSDTAAGGLAVEATPAVVAPADLAAEVGRERTAGIAVVGPGLYPELLGAATGSFDVAALAPFALARAAAGEGTGVAPLYLRRPDIHQGAGSAAP